MKFNIKILKQKNLKKTLELQKQQNQRYKINNYLMKHKGYKIKIKNKENKIIFYNKKNLIL